MAQKPTAKAFLALMEKGAEEPTEPLAKVAVSAVSSEGARETPAPSETTRRRRSKGRPPRCELIHFGGYLSRETFEKIALLRLRLKKDNSELIELAIDELFRKQGAKRAFGDM